MRKDIRFSGIGGQGIMLAGEIFGAAAALHDELNSVQTESYGPEARGSPVHSDVIISDRKIHYPRLVEPDILVVMSQSAFDKYCLNVPSECVILLDPETVDRKRTAVSGTFYEVPFTNIAEELGSRVVANVVMLGSLSAISGVVSKDSVRQAVLDRVPKKVVELNEEALDKGFMAGNKANKYETEN